MSASKYGSTTRYVRERNAGEVYQVLPGARAYFEDVRAGHNSKAGCSILQIFGEFQSTH